MGRVGVAAVVLVLAACSGGAAEPVNRLVVVDGDGRVVTVEADGSDPEVLSEPGTVGFQPVWSPDATRVAWGSTTGGVPALAVADVASGQVTEVETDDSPFYLYWSPAGDRLALLRNDDTGLAFEVATVGDEGVRIATLDTGAPYYFDWRPDGERVASHVGRDRLDLLDLEGGVDETGVNPGTYQAPQWIDRGVLTAEGAADEPDDVVLVDEDGSVEMIARASGIVFFAADPAGDRLAVSSFLVGEPDAVSAAQVEDELAPNTLAVIDLDDGSVEEVVDEPVAAFQWSRDGERLLVLTAGPAEGELRWMVWSEDGLVDGPEFTPLPHWVDDYLPFHDQYARSMTLWSPDGASFAFVGVRDDRAGVWRHDLETGETTFVVEGVWVVWSPV